MSDKLSRSTPRTMIKRRPLKARGWNMIFIVVVTMAILALAVAALVRLKWGDFIGHRGCLAPTSSDTLTQPPAH